MSETASLYFQTVVVTGIFLLLNGLPKFATNDLGRFLVYLSLGMLCTVASGIAFAYDPPHFLLSHGLASVPLMLLFAAVIFWIVNAGLVGGLASLVSNDPFPGVWRILNQHLLGFYIAGGLVAAVVILVDRLWGWQWGALVIPVLYFASHRYRVAVEAET